MMLECSEPAPALSVADLVMNRHAALVALNDGIKDEWSGEEEWLWRTKSNNSFDRSAR
jgi:hypothetical protein